MAHDLASTPTTGLTVQLCGDCHLANFGIYASPERTLVFDINDFDETLPGPWEWDLKRLAASFLVAAHCGLRPSTCARSYCAWSRATAPRCERSLEQTTLEVWYARLRVKDVFPLANYEQQGRIQARNSKAQSRDNLQALSKLTTLSEDVRRIVLDPRWLCRSSQRRCVKSSRLVARAYRETLQNDRQPSLP